MRPAGSIWTEEMDQRLRAFVAGRKLTAATIAQAMGLTRAQVLGRIWRLGLANPAVRGGRPPEKWSARTLARKAAQPARPIPRATKARQSALPTTAVAAAPPTRPCNKPLLDLAFADCRWPVQDGPNWLFCAARKTRGAYCAEHAAMAWRA